MTASYQKVVEELRRNARQWRAFESKGNCVTLAGPGTGKTKVLTAKMALVLREEIRAPHAVACLTYNTECARELDRRLRTLGVADLPNTFIGTLHGFCLRHILAPFSVVAKLDLQTPIRVASERIQNGLFDKAMRNVGMTAGGFRTDVHKFRRTVLDRIQGVEGWEVGDRGPTDAILEYERQLRQHGFVDFDDLVLLAVRAVEGSEVIRRCIRARFPMLLVDEYQDLGVPLHRIVLSLCFGAGVRLFAVGDPDQSIYGFTGARPDLLRELCRRDDVEKIELRLNYRSGRNIVAASEHALGEHRGYSAARSEAGEVVLRQCPDGFTAQVTHLVNILVPSFIAKGDAYGQIAVLYPTQHEGKALEAAFVSHALPFVRLDRGAGYRRTPFIRLTEDLAAWCHGGWRTGRPPLSGLLAKWKAILCERGISGADQRAARLSLVQFMFAARDPEGPTRTWLSGFSEHVFDSHLRNRSILDDDDSEAFDELLSATEDGGVLRDLDIEMFAGKSGSPNHVCLMNLHTAKGTEFNAVVLVGMDNGRMPIYRARTLDDLAEQRRLFFVGVSRARREVHLLYSGFTMNRYGRRFDDGPSPFLLEMQRNLALSNV
ncbi:MAG: ATP-dependent helicase [Deltaproteobacteria bacterium]|nr:ATP-dependent helicase [Deltaproteobacteria bacterium]